MRYLSMHFHSVARALFLLLFSVGCQPNPKSITYDRQWTEEDREFLVSNLEQSFKTVEQIISELDDKKWQFKPDSSSWSAAFVIEHLIVHEELFFREVNVISALPQLPSQPDSLFSSDESILTYTEITNQNTGKSPWYLEPRGRWDQKDVAIDHYRRVRREMISFVSNSKVNLRRYYTQSGRGPTKYRDLHQLLLISIAHTRRHLTQIQNIKAALSDLD